MKKNISINISGIIFHIEEDGFEQLDQYLKSIKTYFSAFEESEEIVLDIENRIAEIFLAKLNEGKQVITAEDVDALVKTMGNVSDFKEVEDGGSDDGPEPGTNSAEYEESGPRIDRKLYRDRSRQIIGGVASGIAHYLRVDPLWVRLLFLIFMFDLAFTQALAPIVFIGYLVLWAIIPGRTDLEEDKKVKKIYRDPDEQVLGGVAGGMANFFGTSVVVVRLLFLLTVLLGGAGVFIYIVLWVIVPQAKTVTEKLEMKGEPVTLENIENSIKRGLNIDKNEEEESTLARILLFPFRLFARVIKALGRVGGPLFRFVIEAARIVAGVFIVLWSLGLMYGLAIAVALWAGAESGWLMPMWWFELNPGWPTELTFSVIRASLSPWIMIPSYIAALIPILFVLIIGISLLAKRWIARPIVNWSLFGIWVGSLLCLAIFVPNLVLQFKEQGEEISTTTLPISEERTLYVQGDGFKYDDADFVRLFIYPAEDDQVRIERIVKSQGRDNQSIQENIAMVQYDVEFSDTTLTIPHSFTFSEGAVFRGQRVRLALYIPQGQPFYLDRNLRQLLEYSRRFDEGLHHQYMFTEEGDRKCLDCPERVEASEPSTATSAIRPATGGKSLDMEVDDYEELIIRGEMAVEIRSGAKNRLQVFPAEAGEGIEVRQLDDRLYLEVSREAARRNMEVVVYTDGLAGIVAEKGASLTLIDWKGSTLDATVVDNSELNGTIEVQEVKVRLEDESRVRLGGTTNRLELEVRDKATFRSYDLEAREVNVDVTDDADVRIRVLESLAVNNSSRQTLRYRGNPQIVNVRGKVLEIGEE